MARLITIEEGDLAEFSKKPKTVYSEELEKGNILFFPNCPFNFPKEDLAFLLAQKQKGAKNRKNIAYKPQTHQITNALELSQEQGKRLLDIMQNYSKRVVEFLKVVLPPYASHWRLDYASYRPFQEKGRPLRTRARNDLLHVDSFPTRPVHGDRIFRFFTNINPEESRFWTTSDPFEDLAERFGGEHVAFPKQSNPMLSHLKKMGRKMGIPMILRSPYDIFMLNMHNFLKENQTFQKECRKDFWEFPPNSCWAVFTDQVSHAATAGQYALEQTFLIPRSGLVTPHKAPVAVLERLSKKKMIDPVLTRLS